jgi:hypothetical protein
LYSGLRGTVSGQKRLGSVVGEGGGVTLGVIVKVKVGEGINVGAVVGTGVAVDGGAFVGWVGNGLNAGVETGISVAGTSIVSCSSPPICATTAGTDSPTRWAAAGNSAEQADNNRLKKLRQTAVQIKPIRCFLFTRK